MEHINIPQFILALAFVAALIYGLGWVMRRSGIERRVLHKRSAGGRMKVVDSLFIDPRTRMVMVECDEEEYLLLLGSGDPVVVEKK